MTYFNSCASSRITYRTDAILAAVTGLLLLCSPLETSAQASEPTPETSDSLTAAPSPPAPTLPGNTAPGDREILRIGVAGGTGIVSEPDAHDRGAFGVGTANVHAFPVAGLDVGLSLDVLSYGRTYVTTAPDGNGAPSGLRVHTSERMVRSRLSVGYEVLHFAVDDQKLVLTPYVALDLLDFVSASFPQRPLAVGGGASFEARVVERLRLLVDFNYTKVISNNQPGVQQLLYFGPLDGVFRVDAGFAAVLGRSARLELRYLGEFQMYQHDVRALHAVVVGPTIQIH